MNRRDFLHGTVTTLGSLGVGADIAGALPPEKAQNSSTAARRPNVLFLMADQHRRTCMGAAGDSVAHTPNLDRFAEQSVRFSSAYCTNPICAPSRASMLTGLYSHELYRDSGGQPFPPKSKTIAEYFDQAGYMTALVGKMHFGDAQVHGFRYQLEFNDWLNGLGPRAKLYADETFYPNTGAGLPQIPSLWKAHGDPWKGLRTFDGRQGSVAVGRASVMEEADQFDSFVARESVRFLEDYAKTDEPFFLVSSFLKPHDPFMPAARFASMFDAQKMQLPASWGHADLDALPKQVAEDIRTSKVTPELLQAPEARQRMASYYGNLAQADAGVGLVLEALARLGLNRNTIVVYTSDHGEMLGDLGLWNKFQFYEGSCGVPLMIRVPGHVPDVCETPVSLISLASTLAELASVAMPERSSGKSFADLVTNPRSTRPYGPIFAEFDLGRQGEKYMVRDGDLKYTYWVHDTPELYDLQTDPHELHNLAASPARQPDVQHLREKLFAWYRPPYRGDNS